MSCHATPRHATPRQSNADVEQGLYGVAEEEEEDLGVPGSPNPLFDPHRTNRSLGGGGGGGATQRRSNVDAPPGSSDNGFADALYSGADFERSKPAGESRVEVVSHAIPQRCVLFRARFGGVEGWGGRFGGLFMEAGRAGPGRAPGVGIYHDTVGLLGVSSCMCRFGTLSSELNIETL